MFAIFLLFSLAVAFPVENITQEHQNATQEYKNVHTLQINVTIEDVSHRIRQGIDEDDAVDLAGENGGLQLATHIVNLLLGGFSGIGNALAGNRGGAMGGTGTGTTGTATGTGTGNKNKETP